MVVWALIAFGLAFGFLPRAQLSPRLVLPLAGGAALACLTAASLSWTGSAEHTFAELARVVFYLGVVALALLALNRHTWRAAALGLATAAVAVCAVALASRLAPGHFNDPVRELFGGDRLSYPLGYWNAVGAWAAMTLVMGLALSANRRSPALRCAALATTPLAGLVLYLTYSRGAVAAAALRLARRRRAEPKPLDGLAACRRGGPRDRRRHPRRPRTA